MNDFIAFLIFMTCAILFGSLTYCTGCKAGVEHYQKELYPELCPKCQQKVMNHIIEKL